MNGLPPADPLLVADTISALPARLRGKLDAAVSATGSWEVDGLTVRLPGIAEVVLRPEGGVLRRADHVVCDCLLAPTCLHRASVLAASPVAAPSRTSDAIDLSDEGVPQETTSSEGAWTVEEQRAAAAVGAAASQILQAGLQGAGAAAQAELLRSLHHARLCGLHRLAAAATRVVTGLRAGRGDDPTYTLSGLSRDLLEVLEVAQAVQSGQLDPTSWRGRARTMYAPVGGMRLTGLCLEPIVTDSGYAGVVVWLVDADGQIWSVSDVKPGGPERVRSAAHAVVALGEAGLSHLKLSRGGMVLSGATANPDGRLGAGMKVRAVSAPGTPWSTEPLRSRFGAATAEARLMLLDLVLCGGTDDAILAIDTAGTGLHLVEPTGAHGTTFRDNLRLLATSPGLRILAVGRLSAPRPRTVELLAVGGGDLRLPDELGGHVDLGVDRLSMAFLSPSQPSPTFPQVVEVADPLAGFRRRFERVVSGGRRSLTVPGADASLRADVTMLRRHQLANGADLLEALVAAGRVGERDVFGRLVDDDPEVLANRWLAAGLYVIHVSASLRATELSG